MQYSLSDKIKMAAAVVLALLSLFLLAPSGASPEAHADTIQYLDDKKVTVLELAGAATAASVAVSALPGDLATPIAENLADLSSYFLVIVSALFLEKYLVTITGHVAFYYLIPIACGLYVIFRLSGRQGFRQIAIRLTAFALAIFFLVPVSVRLSNLVETTYADSIQATIDTALQAQEEAEALEAAEEEAGSEAGQEDTSWLQEKLNSVKETITGVKDTVLGAPEKLEAMLSRFIEAIAVLIVTSCVIPALVLVVFLWLIRLLTGMEVQELLSSSYRRFSTFARRGRKVGPLD